MIKTNRYLGHRFPVEVISTTIWLYYRFALSFRGVEDPLAQRALKRCESKGSDRWRTDEVFVKITGEILYLWRAVDQDGGVLEILVQRRRNRAAAERFFRKLLQRQGRAPRGVVTEKLRLCSVAHRELLPDSIHDTSKYANNRLERSHQSARVRERGMRLVKSASQSQRFLTVHVAVHNWFNPGRQAVSALSFRACANKVTKPTDEQANRAAASVRNPDVLHQRKDAVHAFDRRADLKPGCRTRQFAP